MKILLAPMEGVLDHNMRRLLTRIGGIDRCVTEFVRITDHTLPQRVFLRLAEELKQDGRVNGVPVYVQLLGDNPQALAANAAKVARLGAPGIDLNFGCPAKTVNRSGGGAILLRDPQHIYRVVKAVRDAVPVSTPVTAKIRLGYDDNSLALENALAAEAAGASELVVHGRTKVQGYQPPAYWDQIGHIRASLRINVIANGEIWTPEDYQRCITDSGCQDVMIGRGLLARPDLALAIKQDDWQLQSWQWTLPFVAEYFQGLITSTEARFAGNLLKQWLNYLQKQHPEAQQLFEKIKRLKDPPKIMPYLVDAQDAA